MLFQSIQAFISLCQYELDTNLDHLMRIPTTSSIALYPLAADAVLVLHGLFIAFVIFGLLLVLIGIVARWQWINNFWFRIAHLFAIGIVVGQSWGGITCPLTALERSLEASSRTIVLPRKLCRPLASLVDLLSGSSPGSLRHAIPSSVLWWWDVDHQSPTMARTS